MIDRSIDRLFILAAAAEVLERKSGEGRERGGGGGGGGGEGAPGSGRCGHASAAGQRKQKGEGFFHNLFKRFFVLCFIFILHLVWSSLD